MAPSSRRSEDEEAVRSDSDRDRGSRDEKHPNWASSKAKAVRYRRDRRRSPSRERNRYVEENQGEKSGEDKAEVRREGARRNSDEEIEERRSRMEVRREGARRNSDEEIEERMSRMEVSQIDCVVDPFVQQLVAAFYQCLNSCAGLLLKGNPISLSSLEVLLQNSIRNVEIAGGSAVAVRALRRVVGGFMSAAEEWRSLRAACSAALAEEAEAQREAARKALEALSEEVTQLQARADQISNAREAKSLAKETAENAILNAQTVVVRAQKIIAEQRPKVNLLEEEVAKLFQEQNQVELAIAEKKKAMTAAQARLVNSAALAEAESRQAREALQEQLASREAAMKALLRL